MCPLTLFLKEGKWDHSPKCCVYSSSFNREITMCTSQACRGCKSLVRWLSSPKSQTIATSVLQHRAKKWQQFCSDHISLNLWWKPPMHEQGGRAWDENQRRECTFASGLWQPRYAAKWLFIVTPLSQHDLQYSRTYTKQTPNQGYTLQHHLQWQKYFPNLLLSHPNQCLFYKHCREKKIKILEFHLQLEKTFWFVSSQLFLFEDCQALWDEVFLGCSHLGQHHNVGE